MLLYLWIEEFKNIKQTGFNLSSRYDFGFEPTGFDRQFNCVNRGILTCNKSTSKNRLFAKNIEDIIAIIGENGAGKSTILEVLIQNIMAPGIFSPISKQYRSFNGFLVSDRYVFNRNDIDFGESVNSIEVLPLKILHNRDCVEEIRKVYKSTDEIPEDSYFLADGRLSNSFLSETTTIFFSTLLNSDSGVGSGPIGKLRDSGSDLFDITTENLIHNDFAHLKFMADRGSPPESPLPVHDSSEKIRILNLVLDLPRIAIPFVPSTPKITIQIGEYYEAVWRGLWDSSEHKEESKKFSDLHNSAVAFGMKWSQSIPREELFRRYFFMELLYFCMVLEFRSLARVLTDVKSILSRIYASLSREAFDPSELLHSFIKTSLSFEGVDHETLFQRISSFVNQVSEWSEVSTFNIFHRSFELNFDDREKIKFLLKMFINGISIAKNGRVAEFWALILMVRFPGLSGGERSILSLFARLNEIANQLPKSRKDVLLLLDEPEMAYHPQWQRAFIDVINTSIPLLFGRNKKIQIIITSHSPILISDLPKSNVIFLRKDRETGRCLVADPMGNENTFGANIHSLYSHAFFLDQNGGAMGEFSKNIIQRALRYIEKGDINKADWIEQIIEMIGDPLLKSQMKSFFEERFPEYRRFDAVEIESKIAHYEEFISRLKTQLGRRR